ncbi:hypothetical protein ACP70R_005844 [Stipagrostis hirtigluma subsp. patula]
MDAAAHDLPPDLLRLISGRLHDAADFVRFHAVCKPWRDSLPAPSHTPPFLPWLLAPGRGYDPSIAQFRSIFSMTTWCAPAAWRRRCRWLSNEDGAVRWLLATGGDPSSLPCLVDPFTGAATALPLLPDWIRGLLEGGSGFVSPDGAVVLFGFAFFGKNTHCLVTAAVLRPGDEAWTTKRTDFLSGTCFDCGFAAAYHDGEIVLVDSLFHQHIVKLRVTGGGGGGGGDGGVFEVVRTPTTGRETAEGPSHDRQRIHMFESRGELLVACVVLDTAAQNGGAASAFAGALSVWIYALERRPGANDDGGVRWVRRDGRSLGDRVVFLGSPTSFAADAAPFAGEVSGGCAYFVLNSTEARRWGVPAASGVYKYSFEDGMATVVEKLPFGTGWHDDMDMMWFAPHPSAIAPAHEIRERLLQPPSSNQGVPCPRSIVRHGGIESQPHFKVYVGNLPSCLDSLKLKQFFMMHALVVDARVIRDRRTGRSWGFGFVTMVAIDEPTELFAALDGQDFYGNVLRVKFADERPKGPFVMPLLAQNKKASPAQTLESTIIWDT